MSIQQILAENADFGRRVRSLGVHASYDPEDDLLSVVLGEPVPAITESVDNTLYVRIDPTSRKIVGFEVFDLRSHLAEQPSYLDIILSLLNLINGRPPDGVADAMGEASDRLTAAFRELVRS
jgi:uncharacterized protein YuzE